MPSTATNFITDPSSIPALTSAPTAKVAYLKDADLNAEAASEEQLNLVKIIKKHNIPVKLLSASQQNQTKSQTQAPLANYRQMIGRKLVFIAQQANNTQHIPQNVNLSANYSCISIKLTNKEFTSLDDCFLPLPNDAALIYEGEYAIKPNGEWELDTNNWPVIIEGTATMCKESRALIRSIYPKEKLIIISKAEALAHATNAVILQSPSNGRYKLFVNGKRSADIFIESSAISNQLISMHYTTIKKIIEITNNTADVIEVPYKGMHKCGHSVSSTISNMLSANDNFSKTQQKANFFKKA